MAVTRAIAISGWCSNCDHGVERHDEGVCRICGHQCWGLPTRLVPREGIVVCATSPLSPADMHINPDWHGGQFGGLGEDEA